MDIDKYRRRIQARGTNINTTNKHRGLFSKMYTFVIVGLLGFTIVLGNMIHQQNGFTILFANVETILEPLQTYRLSEWIPFENWFSFGKEETITTSLLAHYEHIENQFYSLSNGQVISLNDGVVIYVSSQESGHLVMVKQDNGILVTYGAMQEVHVNQNDRILSGDILGLSQEIVYLDFTLDGNAVQLADALFE